MVISHGLGGMGLGMPLGLGTRGLGMGGLGMGAGWGEWSGHEGAFLGGFVSGGWALRGGWSIGIGDNVDCFRPCHAVFTTAGGSVHFKHCATACP